MGDLLLNPKKMKKHHSNFKKANYYLIKISYSAGFYQINNLQSKADYQPVFSLRAIPMSAKERTVLTPAVSRTAGCDHHQLFSAK